jgi:hypothetical protein
MGDHRQLAMKEMTAKRKRKESPCALTACQSAHPQSIIMHRQKIREGLSKAN